jgi:hypothetical protein
MLDGLGKYRGHRHLPGGSNNLEYSSILDRRYNGMGELRLKAQIKATRALLKFCQEHRHAPFWVQSLSDCLAALEQRDDARIVEVLERFNRSGMGSYLDWYPEVVFPNEDEDYVEVVWFGLNGYWREMMRPVAGKRG